MLSVPVLLYKGYLMHYVENYSLYILLYSFYLDLELTNKQLTIYSCEAELNLTEYRNNQTFYYIL